MVGLDELLQGRPLADGEYIRTGRRNVGVGFDAAVGERSVKPADVQIVAIRDQQGDHLIRVTVQPGLDGLQE